MLREKNKLNQKKLNLAYIIKVISLRLKYKNLYILLISSLLLILVGCEKKESSNKQNIKLKENEIKIKGGCNAKNGNLSIQTIEELKSIEKQIGLNNDIQVLLDLIKFVKADSLNKIVGRETIQNIYEKIINQNQINSVAQKQEANRVGKIKSFFRVFLDNDNNYPEYSFESTLINELFLILTKYNSSLLYENARNKFVTLREKAKTANDWHIDLEKEEAYNDLLVAVKKSRSNEFINVKSGIVLLTTKKLDPCARKQLWSYYERLLKEGPYYSESGIEISNELIKIMENFLFKENNEEIKFFGEKILQKATILEKNNGG